MEGPGWAASPNRAEERQSRKDKCRAVQPPQQRRAVPSKTPESGRDHTNTKNKAKAMRGRHGRGLRPRQARVPSHSCLCLFAPSRSSMRVIGSRNMSRRVCSCRSTLDEISVTLPSNAWTLVRATWARCLRVRLDQRVQARFRGVTPRARAALDAHATAEREEKLEDCGFVGAWRPGS